MRLEWQTKLETGVEQIDNQHRELYRLVNLVLDPGEETKVEDTLKFLENYVVRHFTDEEALQVASQFPDLPEHKEIHAGQPVSGPAGTQGDSRRFHQDFY